jgi:hypothetical protein
MEEQDKQQQDRINKIILGNCLINKQEDTFICKLCKKEFPEDENCGNLCLRCDSIRFDSEQDRISELYEQEYIGDKK